MTQVELSPVRSRALQHGMDQHARSRVWLVVPDRELQIVLPEEAW
ncbi:hypothetical protein [Deinococcus cellulosilyticus]|nr:hypothetical protein [Deinococcus cellulosilyticus]